MRKISASIILFILCFTHAGASFAADSKLDAFKKVIRAKYDLKQEAFANNDPKYILEKFYASDVISTGPDGVTHEGTEGIRPVYEEVIAARVYIESYNTHVNGNAGWDWANFHVYTPDPAVAPFTFKMLFLWEKIKGVWMSKGEMYVMGEFDTSGH